MALAIIHLYERMRSEMKSAKMLLFNTDKITHHASRMIIIFTLLIWQMANGSICIYYLKSKNEEYLEKIIC